MNTTVSARLRRLTLLGAGLVVLALNPCAAVTISATPPPNPDFPLQWSPGDSVTLSVALSPAPVGSFQWLHDEQPIAGATAASHTLTNLASPDTGNYRLRVTSGNATEFSDATLTINVLPPAPSTRPSSPRCPRRSRRRATSRSAPSPPTAA